MSKTRLLPYRTVGADDVTWGGWWFERNGLREPLPDLLPGWDYASEERIGLNVALEGARLLAATGFTQVDVVEAVAVADCPSMLRRFVARKRLSRDDQQQVELVIELPPGEVAQKLELSAFLLLAEDIPPERRTATRRGSRLATGPERNVLLEGDASRFPTEAVSFSTLRLENAPWTLNAVFDDMSDSFMGSVRLLVNEDHELGRAVLAPAVDPLLRARLQLEILRSLVALASTQEVTESDDFPPDSIGEVVDSMCRLFLNRSLHETIQTYERNPLKFDRLLYTGVGS
ncbi:hypothetical protein [Nocardioides campestrisoli]|uniref:hypothetical protein n=1 Tax=Nocardioides campestrisoli TaxID=2736757 RepID=UPI0015E6D42C|nr:hypothetical protein [Nocardioides campestrisoli]